MCSLIKRQVQGEIDIDIENAREEAWRQVDRWEENRRKQNDR